MLSMHVFLIAILNNTFECFFYLKIDITGTAIQSFKSYHSGSFHQGVLEMWGA